MINWRAYISHLIRVELNKDNWHMLIHFGVVFWCSVYSFRNILKDKVEIQLILVSCWKERMPQSHNIGMVLQAHYLKFPVLVSFILQNLLNCNLFTRFQALGLIQKSDSNSNSVNEKKLKDLYLLMLRITTYLEHNSEWACSNHSLCHVWDCLKQVMKN